MSLIRSVMAFSVILLVFLLVAVWVLLPPEQLPARFTTENCQRVALTGSEGGETVVGVEDVALHPDGSVLILSAHDRSDPDTNGALYVTSLFAVSAGSEAIVDQISPRFSGLDMFRPHGIGISADGRRLAVVNRFREGDARVEIGVLTPTSWEPDLHVTAEGMCRANDVMFTGQGGEDILVTIDRAECEASAQDLLPRRTGSVGRYNGFEFSVIQNWLKFPNGIAGGFVAHTRSNVIAGPDGTDYDVPGGPDNLNIDAEGRVIAALHPKLSLLWLYLEGIQTRAPSRIIALDPATGGIEILYDDPEGTQFSGATSAVLTGGVLVAGSVRDEGLLVCSRAP